MWSAEKLTKDRKKADSMKISVDHSLFFPATSEECAKSVQGLPEQMSSAMSGTYLIGNRNLKPRAKVRMDIDPADSKLFYLRKPSKTRDSSKEGNRVMHTDSHSNNS